MTSSSANPSNIPSISKNEEKNEAKRLAKQLKFQAKQAKVAIVAPKKTPVSTPIATAVKVMEEEAFVNNTPVGEFKLNVVGAPFPATYKPKNVESAWYEWWEKQGYFKPVLINGKPAAAGTYVIPIPPPNVTGTLHLGHALTNAIQDTMTRFNRMKGKTTLWVPGADHAGIATQIVVEKKLMRERGITRHQLGREKFISEVHEWKDVYIHKIYNQLRRLGGSFDWSRAKFTMDPDLCESVTEAFVRLHEDGTIYRANRLVNWCTKLKTAISNLEVEMIDVDVPTMMNVPDHGKDKQYEFGVMHSFAYKIQGSDEKIVVSTTRLETMLGDTAVAVHPTDVRYKHLVGKFCVHPFNNRLVIIVADEYADPAFGTGAVKITPAHDFNDFEVGKRHSLEFINIITDDGKINANGGEFEGLQRFDARIKIRQRLEELGMFIGVTPNKMALPVCTRSGNVVEPLMKPQWWVDCSEMAKLANDAVVNGEIKVTPLASEKEWSRWLTSSQDWCISRQLWWGHRVPAYFVVVEGTNGDRADSNLWVSGRNDEEALAKAKAKFGDCVSIEQDEDVLDTWFSSGLWPFSIMGWPKKTSDYDNFFPNTLLETGCDILFFWVARMVMLSLKLTGKVPFTQVFCHAMVRDAHGRKMSKSLGNVIDPLDVIEGISLVDLQHRLDNGNLEASEVKRAKEGQAKDFPNGIPECGTDALRFTLLAYTSSGRDLNLDILRVDGYRKFCNKLWNATRFANMKLGEGYIPRSTDTLSGEESLASLWILHKLNKAIKEVNFNLEQMNFMQATNAVYQFWLYELCDVYLEVSKPVLDGTNEEAKKAAQDVLYICLDQGLKLLHPFMPFVTEELYQRLPRRPIDVHPSIMLAGFPKYRSEWEVTSSEMEFDYIFALVRSCRTLLADYNMKKDAQFYITCPSSMTNLLIKNLEIFPALIRNCTFENSPTPDLIKGCAISTVKFGGETTNIYLRTPLIDVSLEISKLELKLAKCVDAHNDVSKKITSDGYMRSVRAEIKKLDLEKCEALEKECDAVRDAISKLRI